MQFFAERRVLQIRAILVAELGSTIGNAYEALRRDATRRDVGIRNHVIENDDQYRHLPETDGSRMTE